MDCPKKSVQANSVTAVARLGRHLRRLNLQVAVQHVETQPSNDAGQRAEPDLAGPSQQQQAERDQRTAALGQTPLA